jgi:7-carboxy-7-deazaguanine synthase
VSNTVRISETFLSLQGEGPSAGTPAHFVRLQGCTVGCGWCDTRYAWDPTGGSAVERDALWDGLKALGAASLLVLTGGEPLEHQGIAALIDEALARWERVEVETSGILPPPRSHARLGWNVSPKLAAVTSRSADTWAHAAAWVAEPNATFKLVLGGESDLEEALSLITAHALPRGRVMLMPEGLTDDQVRSNALRLAPACVRHGLRMSPRLHVWMWGARRGA